jgi:hypothetical protein
MKLKVLTAAFAAAFLTFGMTTAAHADSTSGTDARVGYELVSDLVPLPEFIPGLGSLYVKPSTLPAGPFLAYDRQDDLVSTVYMIPLDDLNEQTAFNSLHAPAKAVVQTDIQYNAGHPGVAEPHYHVVLWHVDPSSADLD